MLLTFLLLRFRFSFRNTAKLNLWFALFLRFRAWLRFVVAFVTTGAKRINLVEEYDPKKKKRNNRKIYDDDTFMDSLE